MRECCLPSLLIALKCRMDGLSVVFRCLSYIWRDAAAAVHPSISFSFLFFFWHESHAIIWYCSIPCDCVQRHTRERRKCPTALDVFFQSLFGVFGFLLMNWSIEFRKQSFFFAAVIRLPELVETTWNCFKGFNSNQVAFCKKIVAQQVN